MLVLLPGLGADETLYAPQRTELGDFLVPPWLEPQPGETLGGYGRRMAEALRPRLTEARELVLGGISMGGMVAQEMARHLAPRAVVLVASARRGADLGPLGRLGAALAPVVPRALFEVARPRVSPLVLRSFEPLDQPSRAFLRTLLGRAPSPFLAWGLGAIARWPGAGPLAMPVHQLHGDSDRLIPARLVRADELVPGAGHLVNVTHAAAVNAFLRRHA